MWLTSSYSESKCLLDIFPWILCIRADNLERRTASNQVRMSSLDNHKPILQRKQRILMATVRPCSLDRDSAVSPQVLVSAQHSAGERALKYIPTCIPRQNHCGHGGQCCLLRDGRDRGLEMSCGGNWETGQLHNLGYEARLLGFKYWKRLG